jgi:hypothetical protein
MVAQAQLEAIHKYHSYSGLEEESAPCIGPSQKNERERIQWKLDVVCKIKKQTPDFFELKEHIEH